MLLKNILKLNPIYLDITLLFLNNRNFMQLIYDLYLSLK